MTFAYFWQDMFRRHRQGLWLSALCGALVSLSAVALLGLSGWFLAAAAVAGSSGPVAAQAFNYLLPSAFIRFLAIARTAARYGERYLGHAAGLRAMADLRPALLSRILAAAPDTAAAIGRGDASSRFIQDVGALENALVMQGAPVSAITGIATAAILCLWAGWATALVFLAVAVVTVAISLVLQNFGGNDADPHAAMGALKARFQDIMTVLPDIRAFDMQAPLLAELEALEKRLEKARMAASRGDGRGQAVLLVMTGLGLCGVAAVSVHAPLPALALALLSAAMGFESLGALIRATAQNATAKAARQRVADVFDLPSAATSEAPDLVLDGQRLTPGRTTHLRLDGPSGSGKTRRIEGLAGLRGPDGISDRFALCPQDGAILTGTLRDNLTMALSDGDLETPDNHARLWRALDDACLTERVQALPKGLDTWIGDGGVTLSGGERKRLSLARALLRDAPVLLLDEPTEGLDLLTEARVVDRLEQRIAATGQGVILVSHREAPWRLAARVLNLG